jgi:Ca2+-binding EF-hand superfamily protein
MQRNYLFACVFGVGLSLLSPIATATDMVKLAVEPEVMALEKEFGKSKILSVQLAELALLKLDSVQSKLQTQLQERETACLDDFFTNSCLQELKLKRRELQEILRNIGIDAKSFLRRARADKTKNSNEQIQ